MKGSAPYAHRAGIADAAFGGAVSRDDSEEMHCFANEAPISMVLARHYRENMRAGTLQQLRLEGAAQLFHEGATDDSIDMMVQECGDTRRAPVRADMWREDPAL